MEAVGAFSCCSVPLTVREDLILPEGLGVEDFYLLHCVWQEIFGD